MLLIVNSTTYCLSYFSSICWNESRSECNANKFRSTMTYCKVVEEQEHVFTVLVHNSPWCQQKRLHGPITEQAKSMKFVSSCLHYLASVIKPAVWVTVCQLWALLTFLTSDNSGSWVSCCVISYLEACRSCNKLYPSCSPDDICAHHMYTKISLSFLDSHYRKTKKKPIPMSFT